ARTSTVTFKGKTGGRSVPISDAAVALFKRLSKDKLPAAPMLTQDDGKPWKHSKVWADVVRAAAKKAELPAGVSLRNRHGLSNGVRGARPARAARAREEDSRRRASRRDPRCPRSGTPRRSRSAAADGTPRAAARTRLRRRARA